MDAGTGAELERVNGRVRCTVERGAAMRAN